MYAKGVSSTIIGAIGFLAVAQLVTFIKISMVAGSYAAFFSFNNCLLPLSGAFLGIGAATIIMLGKIIVAMIKFGSLLPLSYGAFYIPGFFAAWYWASTSIIIRLIVPFICMVLFIFHPIGAAAWLYAMYWWIPIILYCMKKNNLISTAFGSTFVAHAVGSVIWLYTVPMAASTWLALLPVVAIERVLFAVGSIMLYRLIHRIGAVSNLREVKRIEHLA